MNGTKLVRAADLPETFLIRRDRHGHDDVEYVRLTRHRGYVRLFLYQTVVRLNPEQRVRVLV